MAFDPEEIRDLKALIFGERGHAEGAMYVKVHRYLAECALELLSKSEWSDRLNEATVRGRELVLPD
jgi:hypothetical protein